MHRAGVQPGAPVVALAAEIARRPGLRFVGVAGWESQATRIADPVEKERTVVEAIRALTASARACAEAGHDVSIVSCGGTGTFPYCAQQPGVTEVQTGGAIFSDIHYRTQLPRAFPVRAHRARHRHQPADADADRARRRQEDDERRCGSSAAARDSPRRGR